MALAITQDIAEVCFAKNPAIIQLRATQTIGGLPYSAQGVRADIALTLTNRLSTGQTITVAYTEPDGTSSSIVFSAVASPSGTNDLPNNTFVGTDQQYWIRVAAAINGHPRVAPWFTCILAFDAGSWKIRIQARYVETGWALTVTNSPGYAVTATAATADATPPNYTMMLEVFFERSYRGGDFERVAQMEGTPDNSGFHYFDLSGVLEAECRSSRIEPLVPEYGTTLPRLADNLRRYYIRYTEQYGAPAANQPWTTGAVKYCLDGGVAQSVFAEGNFLDALSSTDSLLTWMPDGREVGLAQPEYIAWYNYTGGETAVGLQVKTYDVDTGGVKATSYLHLGSSVTVRPYETVLLPCGPALLGTIPDDVYKYTVQVIQDPIDGPTPLTLSQVRKYLLDRDYYDSERYVQYLNGFGVPECWRCTGAWTKGLRVDRQVSNKPLLPGYNELASDTYQYGRLWDNQLTYRTGYLRRSEAEVLQELLIAGELYDVSAEGYLPLRITNSQFPVSDSLRDLNSYEISAEPRLDMRNYSKKKLNNLLSGAWQEPGGDAWFDAFLIPWSLP